MEKLSLRIEIFAEKLGNVLVTGFHLLALFAIGGAVIWSAAFAFWTMVKQGGATVEDILLLFIYLELGAMVGIYFTTKRMPVRFLIYVAITALTRMMISVINVDHSPEVEILYISSAILLLALAILVLRYGSVKFPNAPNIVERADSDS